MDKQNNSKSRGVQLPWWKWAIAIAIIFLFVYWLLPTITIVGLMVLPWALGLHPVSSLIVFFAIYISLLILTEKGAWLKDPFLKHLVAFAATCLLCLVL